MNFQRVSVAGIVLDRARLGPCTARPCAGQDGRDMHVTVGQITQGGDGNDTDMPHNG
jgi:hypothetical protein